jgi:hypothetical protein
MRFVWRFAPLLGLLAGCGFAQKPYADDPLLRGGRSVWTLREPPAAVAPQPPAAPPPIEPPAPPIVPISPRWE